MAPSYLDTTLTPVTLSYNSTATYANSYYNDCYYVPKKVETKKEKQARLAKEKMHASWKTYNEVKPKIFEIKQICKPRHRLNHIPR